MVISLNTGGFFKRSARKGQGFRKGRRTAGKGHDTRHRRVSAREMEFILNYGKSNRILGRGGCFSYVYAIPAQSCI